MNGSRTSGTVRPPITVKVKHEIEHAVRVQDFERWLEASPRSPAEMILKNHLREIAKGSGYVAVDSP